MIPPSMGRIAQLAQRVANEEQFRLRPSGPGRVLDIGCGRNKWPGAFGVDISEDTDADAVMDLNSFPYDIESDSFDQILCQDVIEHVEDPYRVMAELHRIGKPGARVHIRTPHFSSVLAYGDPTHRHYLSALAVRALAEPLFSHYTETRFRVVHVTIDLWTPFRLLGIGAFANRFQREYEAYLAFRFPAMNIRAEFEVLP